MDGDNPMDEYPYVAGVPIDFTLPRFVKGDWVRDININRAGQIKGFTSSPGHDNWPIIEVKANGMIWAEVCDPANLVKGHYIKEWVDDATS